MQSYDFIYFRFTLYAYIVYNAQEDALYCTQQVYIASMMRRETVLIFFIFKTEDTT